MKLKNCILPVFLLLQTANVSIAQFEKPELLSEDHSKAFNDLKAYYDKGTVPPYKESIDSLNSKSDSVRNISAEYIFALCVQSLADETNGRVGWEKMPFFYEKWNSKAQSLRESLAYDFGEKANSVESLKIAEWFINKDYLQDNKLEGLKVLRRIRCAGTDNLLEQLISNPDFNAEITINVIGEIADRNLSGLFPKIDSLQNHYRLNIREAVYLNAKKMDIKKRPFDITKAITPWIESQFDIINNLILDSIPEKSPFVNIKSELPGSRNRTITLEYTGWIIDEDSAFITLLDYSAQKIKIEKKYSTIKSASLAEESTKLLDKERMDDFMGRRGVVRPHQGYEIIPNFTIAVWCYNNNLKKEAATLLFEVINLTGNDSDFVQFTRDCFGNLYYNELLYAFSHERNYDKALILSGHLSGSAFINFRYQKDAIDLGQQLKERTADFKTLNLPSVQSWDSIRDKLTRSEQIDFLLRRIKILNCIQDSQPGGIWYGSTQYSVPTASFSETVQLLNNFPWHYDVNESDGFKVINPYVELLEMKLNTDDIKLIAPYLANQDYILAYSFFRDFQSQRRLHKVNWVISDIILNSICREFVDLNTFNNQDSVSKQKEITKILNWCNENKNKTEEELLIDVLKESDNWHEFETAMGKCRQNHFNKAVPVLVDRVYDFNGEFDWPSKKGEILKVVFEMDSQEDVDINAIKILLNDNDKWAKLWASLFLLKNDYESYDMALNSLSEVLKGCDGTSYYPYAMETLLSLKDKRALTLAEGILEKAGFQRMLNWEHNQNILKMLILSKSEATFRFLYKGLTDYSKNDDVEVYNKDGDSLVPLNVDKYIDVVSKWREGKEEYSYDWNTEQRIQYSKGLAEWLQEQFKLILSAKEHQIITKMNDVAIPVSRLDAP